MLKHQALMGTTPRLPMQIGAIWQTTRQRLMRQRRILKITWQAVEWTEEHQTEGQTKTRQYPTDPWMVEHHRIQMGQVNQKQQQQTPLILRVMYEMRSARLQVGGRLLLT